MDTFHNDLQIYFGLPSNVSLVYMHVKPRNCGALSFQTALAGPVLTINL